MPIEYITMLCVHRDPRTPTGIIMSVTRHNGYSGKHQALGLAMQTVKVPELVNCCDSLLNCAVVALNTRSGDLKAKCNKVDVEDDEDSMQGYQGKKDVQ
jgi:hypothetical protein